MCDPKDEQELVVEFEANFEPDDEITYIDPSQEEEITSVEPYNEEEMADMEHFQFQTVLMRLVIGAFTGARVCLVLLLESLRL